jgi:hypothetical protein
LRPRYGIWGKIEERTETARAALKVLPALAD